jgi:hypothetical protein
MIILEGPDGSGKTTLMQELVMDHGFKQRPRFSTHSGPLDNLYRRVYQDLEKVMSGTEECGVYDRHSLMSEYIYGQIRPDSEINPDFLWPGAADMVRALSSRCLLVLCLPPLHVVTENVLKEDTEQMVGVRENIFRMYQAYQVMRIFWPSQNRLITYDYTSDLSRRTAISRINLHRAEWNKHNG